MENKTVTTKTKYPDKPITLIVPFGVGGGMDLVARLLEKTATTHLGQPLIILNKPGGAGTIGWNELSNANPDGYTLGMTGVEVILQPLYGVTKFHYPTALDPIVQIASLSIIMVVKAEQPWENVNELITYAKQHPEQVKFGHGGVGSIAHVTGETFAKAADIHLEQVPFQSAAEAMANLLGGHVQIAFVTPASAKEYLKNNMVKVLAIAADKRLNDPNFTNVPTFKEQKLDVIYNSWFGIAAPKGLPLEVKEQLSERFKTIINDPQFKANVENLGLQVTYLGPKEFEEQWIIDNQKLSKTIQETGILEKIKAQKK